ncbi:MAG: YgjV family protein [Bacteroidales bacterium]|nr:YgjV family protein [Bacteroidales bacterium]
MNWMEWIGYAASALILISMLMTSIIRLRLINLMGSLLFTAYGLLIEAYPVALMNFCIVIVNMYYLFKINSAKKDYFSILETKPNSEYVKEFLRYYSDDIKSFNPQFNIEQTRAGECWLLLRKMTVAGIFMGYKTDADTFCIELDYILKQYRDFQIGTFLYKKNQQFFIRKGIHKLKAIPASQQHNEYLKSMGFRYENGYFYRLIDNSE